MLVGSGRDVREIPSMPGCPCFEVFSLGLRPTEAYGCCDELVAFEPEASIPCDPWLSVESRLPGVGPSMMMFGSPL